MILQNLDASDLGPDATADDVTLFRDACEVRMEQTGCTEKEASDYVFGDGDWYARAESLVNAK